MTKTSTDAQIVGSVSFINGDARQFTDAKAYLDCIREELPYEATTGFRFRTITQDPAIRKATDDIVRDFYGVLSDLDNVSGIMVTKIGYQEGAKKIGSHYGISLKELRTPNQGEAIVAEVKTCINVSVRHCLFEVDDIWAKENGLDLQAYRERLDCLNFPPKEKWLHSIYIPLQVKDRSICNAKGEIIDTLDNLENQLRPDEDHIFSLENSYIDTHCGLVKIRAIKYEYEQNNKTMNISIDAQEFIKAILKDALNGEIRLVAKR